MRTIPTVLVSTLLTSYVNRDYDLIAQVMCILVVKYDITNKELASYLKIDNHELLILMNACELITNKKFNKDN